MQKTGLTKYSLFLFWPGLGKGITYSCDHYGAINDNFHVYSAIFGTVTNNNEQPGDPSASLPLTSERVVFCNKMF